jgi:hypothetical protein
MSVRVQTAMAVPSGEAATVGGHAHCDPSGVRIRCSGSAGSNHGISGSSGKVVVVVVVGAGLSVETATARPMSPACQ